MDREFLQIVAKWVAIYFLLPRAFDHVDWITGSYLSGIDGAKSLANFTLHSQAIAIVSKDIWKFIRGMYP